MLGRVTLLLAFAFCTVVQGCKQTESGQGQAAPAVDAATSVTDASLDANSTRVDANPSIDARADAGREPDLTKLAPGCFSASDAAPQLTKGSLLDGANWNDPWVLKEESDYVMYASADKNFDGAISIYRITSSEGKTWVLAPDTPVLMANEEADAWDHKAVETPSVVRFQGSYHLFYTGYPNAFSETSSYRIGHAVSEDGIRWTRDAVPLLAPSCPGFDPAAPNCPQGAAPTDFYAFLVAEPGAVVFDNQLWVYFAASGYNSEVADPLLTIGRIGSKDGRTWSSPEQVLLPDQIQHPRTKWLGYSTPAPIVLGSELHLFFDVVQDMPFAQLALHHARSEDGKTFTIDASAIYDTTSFPWATREIRAPAAWLDNVTLRLWFAGDDGSTLAIGEANCAL